MDKKLNNETTPLRPRLKFVNLLIVLKEQRFSCFRIVFILCTLMYYAINRDHCASLQV